ncbi:hypothetical protein IAR55_006724 [Kwoniella newhampshirensis]|uniref:Uncharacterized protein n=1 Tax=Kwoniella newhampshirensis TaxID=1651941 RepID=A0AAW0YSJ1_9TREE
MSTLPSPPSRRQLAVAPGPPHHRAVSPAPHTTPPVTSDRNHANHTEAGPSGHPIGRSRVTPHVVPVRKRSLPMAAPSTHPLQMEIDRLTAVCEEHERVIRSGLSTVKHHLLTMTPDIIERLHKSDDDAETITASIQQSLQDHIPPFQSHLRKIIQQREGDVDLMRRRTTPWRDVVSVEDKETAGSAINGDGPLTKTKEDGGGLKRLTRIVDGPGNGERDALTRVELWADEVDMYLTSEIVRVKERLASKRSKRRLLIRAIQLLSISAAIFLGGLVLSMLIAEILSIFKPIWRP